MDKETLSNYGWIVILVLILAVMLALATPFGTFVAGAIKSTTAGLFDVNKVALGSAGINVDDLVFENCDHLETELCNVTDTYTGDTCCRECGTVLHTGTHVIPEGAVYYVGVTSRYTGNYTGATETYTASQGFPDTVRDGDVYIYGDYEYRYNYHVDTLNAQEWQNENIGGWGVRVISRGKTSYGEILTEINGKPITSVKGAFNNCTLMTVAPAIPATVINMTVTFNKCSSLTDISNVTIPSGVKSLYHTFSNNPVLNSYPEIPYGVEEMYCTFTNCTGLIDASNMIIPNSVKVLWDTFYGCTGLTTAPVIPESVTDMTWTFRDCSSLTGIVTINANPTKLQCCFGTYYTSTGQDITLAGSSTQLQTLANTSPKGLRTVYDVNGNVLMQ